MSAQNLRLTKSRDIRYMTVANELAKTKIGLTGSNPSVACLVVKEDVVVARGVTGISGTPHAESVALEKAGKNALGATMYVTLEPCYHHGKTLPCKEEVLQSGIKRVVIATPDPDKRTNGKSIKFFKENKIDVAIGICKKDAIATNIGYFYRNLYNRPYITLKVASTLDGKIACHNGQSKWITSVAGRRIVQKIRLQNDSIMVGKNTLTLDDPSLDCRLPGMENCDKKKFVLDATGSISNTELAALKNGKLFSLGAKNNLEHENFESIEVNTAQDNKVDIDNVVKKLAELGVNNLLIEGGNKIATEFLKKDLIDKIFWMRSNTIAGGDAFDAFGALDIQNTNDFYRFAKIETKSIGSNTMEIFTKIPTLDLSLKY